MIMMMKVLVCFLVFSLAITAALAGYQDDLSPEEALTADDFYEYFKMENRAKRGEEISESEKRARKVGPCQKPGGATCDVCNLKITNKNNRNRYVICNTGKSRKV